MSAGGGTGDAAGAGRTADWLGRGLGATGAGAAAGWVAPAAEALAEAFPGLRVVELRGRGGMGAVYQAEQVRLGRKVAVKVLPPGATPDPLARERFEREARILSGLNHPHIVPIHDFGALADGTLYLVMEWAEGGDLAGRLADGPQPWPQVCAWVEQIAGALAAAHARGVVHRDLKPANILVLGDGRLALADFGLAHAAGAGFTTALTLSGTIFGTFDYMAPEQMGAPGPVTPAVDIFALGVLTYQLLTGRVPRGAYAPASRLAGVPAAVDALLDAALASEPEKRPRDAREFARRLAAAGRRGGGVGRAGWIALAGAGVILATWFGVRGGEGGVPRESGTAWKTPRGEPVLPAKTLPAPEPVVILPAEKAPAAKAAPAPDATPVPEVAPALEKSTPPENAPGPAVATSPVPASSAVLPLPPVQGGLWTQVLPTLRLAEQIANGGWSMRGGELSSDAAVCALRLPVAPPADFSYDIAVEFTRTGGRHSVGVFLPTAAGTGVFELDAWESGLGGLQLIDGQDMRAHGLTFPAVLRNGERQRLILEVRGTQVTAIWNGATRKRWDLAGRQFTNNWMWDAGADMGLGLASWKSPTVFHRVAYRAVPSAGRGG